jgi:C1A family cysteine protease
LTARAFGWVRDAPDHRDFRYEPGTLRGLPSVCDLRPLCPPVRSQGSLNSCTAHAVAAAVQYDLRKQGLPALEPSRLFIYYNARVREHTVESNAGVPCRETLKCVKRLGACPETLWPYRVHRFTRRPPTRCYRGAPRCRVAGYHRLDPRLGPMRACLHEGYPFAAGIVVYSGLTGIRAQRSGVAELPQPGERRIGTHVVLVVGYRDRDARFIVRNSWGAAWGQRGYFTLPYEYLENEHLAGDFWTVRAVKEIVR